jgi:hypothetical protein
MPKETAVERIGRRVDGFANLGRICGVHTSTPSNWNRAIGLPNGRGGAIPDRYFPKIIKWFADKGKRLRPGELING